MKPHFKYLLAISMVLGAIGCQFLFRHAEWIECIFVGAVVGTLFVAIYMAASSANRELVLMMPKNRGWVVVFALGLTAMQLFTVWIPSLIAQEQFIQQVIHWGDNNITLIEVVHRHGGHVERRTIVDVHGIAAVKDQLRSARCHRLSFPEMIGEIDLSINIADGRTIQIQGTVTQQYPSDLQIAYRAGSVYNNVTVPNLVELIL